MYAISKLINEVISQSKEAKRNVVLKLGYKNINKGYRRLNALIETGVCPLFLKEKLPKALNLDKELIDQAFVLIAQEKAKEAEEARQRREEYERKHFKPHLWIEHERKYPQGASFWYVVFIGIHHFKALPLPENINDMDWELQESLVKERILQHQKDCNSDDAIFGRVTGYTYCQTYDDSFLFSVDGKLVRRHIEKVDKPEMFIEIGNRSISGELIDKLGYRKKER